jgi:flagellar assembly protein FliH
MGRPRKYLFDTSFDDAAPVPPLGGGGPDDLPPTRAEIEAARAEGLSQGRTDALFEMAGLVETRTADAMAALEHGVAALLAARAAITAEIESQAIALVRTVLQKAVPALCRIDPATEIEALLARCLSEALDEPRVVLRVNDALFDAMQSRLGAITQANGYAGKLILIADAALADGDGRVEWADGGAERDTRRLMAEIDAILSRNLDAPPAPPLDPKEIDSD